MQDHIFTINVGYIFIKLHKMYTIYMYMYKMVSRKEKIGTSVILLYKCADINAKPIVNVPFYCFMLKFRWCFKCFCGGDYLVSSILRKLKQFPQICYRKFHFNLDFSLSIT